VMTDYEKCLVCMFLCVDVCMCVCVCVCVFVVSGGYICIYVVSKVSRSIVWVWVYVGVCWCVCVGVCVCGYICIHDNGYTYIYCKVSRGMYQ